MSDNIARSPMQGNNFALGKNPLTWIMFILAFAAAIFIKPAQFLTRKAYWESNLGPVPWLAGLAVSAGAALGLGYESGWVQHHNIQTWLGLAVGASLASYFYLWPIAYLSIFQWSFRVGKFLWARVPEYEDRHRIDKPAWLTVLLTWASVISVGLTGLYAFYHMSQGIYAYLGWGNFFATLISYGVSFAVSVGISSLLISLMYGIGMPILAVASGLALSWYYAPALTALATSTGLSSLSFLANMSHWLNYVSWFGITFMWTAYGFPLVHILVSRVFHRVATLFVEMLEWVFDHWGNVLDLVYDNDNDKNYQDFIQQVGILVATGFAGYYAYLTASKHELYFVTIYAIAAVSTLAAYVIGGSILKRILMPYVIGTVTCFGSAYWVYYYGSTLINIPFGIFGLVVACALTIVLGYIFVFPVAYLAVRAILKPLLASWLSKPLSKLHNDICQEIFSSFGRTYTDTSDYAKFFAHACNIALTAGVYFGLTKLMLVTTFTPAMALGIVVSGTIASYLLIGKWLVYARAWLPSSALSLCAGAYTGVTVYAMYNKALWYGIASFLGSGLAIFLIAFPVCYVVLRALLKMLAVQIWLLPIIGGVHGFFYSFIQMFFDGVVAAYRAIGNWFYPAWQAVSRIWDESWNAASRVIAAIFGQR